MQNLTAIVTRGSVWLVGVFAFMAIPGASFSWSSEWVEREHAKFRLVPATAALDDKNQWLAALEVQLEPDWLFSYVEPGKYGVAPNFDWARSTNIGEVAVHWPSPERVQYSVDPPIEVIGYHGTFVLPVAVQPQDLAAECEVRLTLEYAICHEFCLVDVVELRTALPPDSPGYTAGEQRFRQLLGSALTVTRQRR